MGKWESCFWISTFPWRSWPGLRECGNRDSDFQGLVGSDGKPGFGFPRCPQPGIAAALFLSCRLPVCKAFKQFPPGCLHLDCGADIAVRSRSPFQLVDGEIAL